MILYKKKQHKVLRWFQGPIKKIKALFSKEKNLTLPPRKYEPDVFEGYTRVSYEKVPETLKIVAMNEDNNRFIEEK